MQIRGPAWSRRLGSWSRKVELSSIRRVQEGWEQSQADSPFTTFIWVGLALVLASPCPHPVGSLAGRHVLAAKGFAPFSGGLQGFLAQSLGKCDSKTIPVYPWSHGCHPRGSRRHGMSPRFNMNCPKDGYVINKIAGWWGDMGTCLRGRKF